MQFTITSPEALAAEQARQDKRHAELQQRYNNDPDLKAKADAIHKRRLADGNACDDCIELALGIHEES